MAVLYISVSPAPNEYDSPAITNLMLKSSVLQFFTAVMNSSLPCSCCPLGTNVGGRQSTSL